MPTENSIVELRGQQAFTTSLVIAEQCGKPHKNVIGLIRRYEDKFAGLGTSAFETRKSGGRETEIAMLNEDQATFLITLFRNSPVVVEFKFQLVKAFRKALNEIGRLYANPPRKDILRDKRQAHHPMMDALTEFREELGKETCTVQYMSENKLCNFIVTGCFAKIDEKALRNEDVELLAAVRKRNEAYLLAGLEYNERKAKLVKFSIRRRTAMNQLETTEAVGA